jgi:ribosome-associated protein
MVTEDQHCGLTATGPSDMRPGIAFHEDRLSAEAALDDCGDSLRGRGQGVEIERRRLDFDKRPEVLDHRLDTDSRGSMRRHRPRLPAEMASGPANRRPWEDPYMPVRRPVDVPIREESIRLGQFLKLADLVEVGSDAKELILAGEVLVNGEPETRRGRQLRVGDVVELDGRLARVAGRGHASAR